MIVTKQNFDWVVSKLSGKSVVALDCETTGIRPHHGDRLFSIAMADDEDAYYFNYQNYDGMDQNLVLPRETIPVLLKNLHGVVAGHNIKFDLHFLLNEGVRMEDVAEKHIWDTMVVARLLNNDALSLSLDACAKEIGEEKDSSVDAHIKKFKLYEVVTIPGKKTRFKNLQFNRVPFELISKYAEKDAKIAYRLQLLQDRTISEWDLETHSKRLRPLLENESRLLKVCLEIERSGIAVDSSYIGRAIEAETRNLEAAKKDIEKAVGRPFTDSRKFLQEVFPDWKVKLTEKGNKSFDEESLAGIDHPVAKLIEKYRDHLKRKNTYFEAFKFHMASDERIHPTLNQHAAQTGRFSIKDPALQTLNKGDDKNHPYAIRRAFIPSPGNCLVEMDYKSMEFVLMCDYAGEKELIEKLKSGHDPHQATADLVGVSRREAKTLNFMLLYGGGAGKLSAALEIPLEEAQKIKAKYFAALPAVNHLIQNVTRTAKKRGYIFNFMGRRFRFPDPKFCYKATNALIQGSGADTCKIAMVRLHDFLKKYETRIVLQIHDSILYDMPPHEFHLIPHLKKIMEEAYPFKHIPLSVTVEHSWKSWGDLIEGVPSDGRETRKSVQASGEEVPEDPGPMLVCQSGPNVTSWHPGLPYLSGQMVCGHRVEIFPGRSREGEKE